MFRLTGNRQGYIHGNYVDDRSLTLQWTRSIGESVFPGLNPVVLGYLIDRDIGKIVKQFNLGLCLFFYLIISPESVTREAVSVAGFVYVYM